MKYKAVINISPEKKYESKEFHTFEEAHEALEDYFDQPWDETPAQTEQLSRQQFFFEKSLVKYIPIPAYRKL